jgi:AbrB family looped-hinge helix DNA binding protein
MKSSHVEMSPDGKVVIPADVRAELGLSAGAKLVLEIEDGMIKLIPFSLVIQRIQAEVRRYVPEGCDLASELLEDRRREAERE